jgi:acyl-lipid omega-6 desaturase (Delta-12 desaturase)
MITADRQRRYASRMNGSEEGWTNTPAPDFQNRGKAPRVLFDFALKSAPLENGTQPELIPARTRAITSSNRPEGGFGSLLLAMPAAGFLVRLFMIQHDCGHGSFFHNRSANDWVGRVIGVLTLTPYDFWRRTHAMHHAGSGHLERRGLGDVDILTVREYMALSFWGRLRYRVYRHPSVMFGIGPAYLFILKHRLPVGLLGDGWQPWLSTMATNFAIAVIAAGLIRLIGIGPFLFVHLPIMLLAGLVGVWLFYVQHQFEMTFWAHDGEWTFQEAALRGSSHYDLPRILRWFTANIGMHHIHHLCSRIPYYRLPLVLRDYPELSSIGRLTLVESFRCVRLVLWDEGQQRLVSFREVRQRYALV